MLLTRVAILRLTLVAVGHGEIDVEWDLAAIPCVAGRQGADNGGGVEYMVVERKVVRRDFRHTAIALLLPARGSERLCRREKLGSARLS
ncbi:hypothetical protein MesoLj131a_61770 [Mesorhizobium sp. 131-2-1]|nr:hypothetical protein MesoLj131a_61770 [Mesorhizobium sp. 131-2-1]